METYTFPYKLGVIAKGYILIQYLFKRTLVLVAVAREYNTVYSGRHLDCTVLETRKSSCCTVSET
jgi:hypothetical protein